MFLALGIMTALWERERSGKGQVVDAAIVDGVSSLMTMFAGMLPSTILQKMHCALMIRCVAQSFDDKSRFSGLFFRPTRLFGKP